MAKRKKYWDTEEEDTIREYIKCISITKKHKLYEQTIRPAFLELIKNIYFTYNFNKTLGDFSNIELELEAFLYERINKFDIDKGAKSFSFFGTIVKNWLIQQSNKAKNQVAIETDEDERKNHLDFISYDVHHDKILIKENIEFVKILADNITKFSEQEVDELNDDDIVVIDIIKNLLQNYDDLNIYSKKHVYVYIKEGTGLPSRKVTKTIKKLKTIYETIKTEYYER